MLMKFIDGTATKEEVDLVEAYLAENENATAELLQMIHASNLVGSQPFEQVDGKRAADFVSRHIAKHDSTRVVRLKWILGGSIAVAATVAIILGVSLGTHDSGVTPLQVSVVQKATSAVDSVSFDAARDTLEIQIPYENE